MKTIFPSLRSNSISNISHPKEKIKTIKIFGFSRNNFCLTCLEMQEMISEIHFFVHPRNPIMCT